jgi:tetratricopeptide (TPR) repeat protein
MGLLIASCRKGQYVHGNKFVSVLFCFCLLFAGPARLYGDAQQALDAAITFVENGQLEQAEQQAKTALADPQTRPAAYSILGTIRLQQRRLADSAAFLEKAIQLQPHLVGARLTLAEVYRLQGKPALSSAMFERVLSLDPSNSQARLVLAQNAAEKGKYRHSLDLAQPLLATLKQSPDGLFLLATDYLGLSDRAAVAGLAHDWAKIENIPTDWSIKFGLLLAKGGVVPEAIDILEKAKLTQPVSYDLAFNIAGVYLLNHDAAHALENYDLAISRNPVSLTAFRQAATVAEANGELERSLSYWIQAKKLEPDNPEVLLGFGRVCLKMDLLDDAEEALERAAKTKPQDSAYQYILASAKVGKKKFEAAQSILENLVAKSPQDARLQYALGSVLYLEGHLDESAARLNESIRLQPDQLSAYYYAALVARDQGKGDHAIQQLEDLLRRNPDHAPSYEVLGTLLMNAHRYVEAQKDLEKAVALNPESLKANYQLGLLLARLGENDEAEKRMRIAKSLRVEDEDNSRLQLRLLDPDRMSSK